MEAVRAHAEKRVNGSSLRAVASEMDGMNFATLGNFIDGASPHTRVWTILAEWYLREQGDGAEARVALHLLCGFFPAAERTRLRTDLLDTMERRFHESGRESPPWLANLRGSR